MTTEADRQAATRVVEQFDVGPKWMEALDPDAPEWLVAVHTDWVRAYREADMDWILEHSHPDLLIVQPKELPDGNSYTGRDGMVQNLLDWPREWEDFQVDPQRVFAVREGVYVIDGIHRGRSIKMGYEIEAQIVWLLTVEDGLLRRWEMFLNVEDAVAAGEAGAD